LTPRPRAPNLVAMAIRAEAVKQLIPFINGFQAYAFIG
jgi:hypothetical protein